MNLVIEILANLLLAGIWTLAIISMRKNWAEIKAMFRAPADPDSLPDRCRPPRG